MRIDLTSNMRLDAPLIQLIIIVVLIEGTDWLESTHDEIHTIASKIF